MKHILCTFAFSAIFIVSGYSQQSDSGVPPNGHIAFLGIPVEGKADTFCAKLAEKKYSKTGATDIMTAYKGLFLNKECNILVKNTPVTKLIVRVAVAFPKQSKWHSLKSEFMELRENLKAKYGKPSDTYEFFSSPYKEGRAEMHALHSGNAHFFNSWHLGNGTIGCVINEGGFVAIIYENAENTTIDTTETAKRARDQL